MANLLVQQKPSCQGIRSCGFLLPKTMALDNVLDQFFQNLLLFWFEWRYFFGSVLRMT
jgi:hypothetical protein